ncbi:MAG TPA: glycoside hydrolase family 44 protein [Terracidiphilus sp.]|nr:glycoside hydrolase family 44 protein [Terracidiphilus sp.]
MLALAADLLAGCAGGGGGKTSPPPATTYTLTVASTNPASGVSITLSPVDNNGANNGTTSFSRTYNAGSTVTLTAPSLAGGNVFTGWSGCTPTSSADVCTLTINADTTATAAFSAGAITAITVTPNMATIGTQVQFTAAVTGTGTFSNAVTWSVAAPTGSTLSPGTISSSGLYTTPYPAPPTVTVTATSSQDTSKSGSVVVTLTPPAVAAGPALTVDAGNQTHTIGPYIYGMNGYTLTTAAAQGANVPLVRWGGDATSRYNYQLQATNSASDYFFENQNTAGTWPSTDFNSFVTGNQGVGAKTLGTVPVLGWVAKDTTSCSFPVATYPNQQSTDTGRSCGNGVYPDGVGGCTSSSGCNIAGVSPSATSVAADPTWVNGWVTSLVGAFGTAAAGGVSIYDLDNEPTWWDAVHRDVHPVAATYDEVTNNGIATALAIKNADATAEVSGPVVDYWMDYFYSKKDIESGWSAGPCYEPWSSPVDRAAHGGVPFIEYYLQQFKAAETTNGKRLLDYVDLHTYFAADYNGASVAFNAAGDTGEQQARLNSTRVFWDPTYTDPNYTQPNYLPTDSSNCNPPLQAPQVIRMMKTWVANDYPGTKTAITEYNWGGQEHINGALTQADILGIFGREGLDIGTLWGPPNPSSQIPGLMAFEIYRNYDGHNAAFGDTALNSTTADQSQLAVYGALRSSDGAITIVVINKSYGDLTSTVSLPNSTPTASTAQAWMYSSANLAAIVAQPAVSIKLPATGSTTSTLATTFPAQSITLLVVPN